MPEAKAHVEGCVVGGDGQGGERNKRRKNCCWEINVIKILEGFWAEPWHCLLHIPSSFDSVIPAAECAKHGISDHEYIFPRKKYIYNSCIYILLICIYYYNKSPELSFYFDYWKWQKPCVFILYVAYKAIVSRDNIWNKSKNNHIFMFCRWWGHTMTIAERKLAPLACVTPCDPNQRV